MRRPRWPAGGAAPQRSPAPGGTAATAATRSPAAAGTPGTPAASGRGSGPSGHNAAGTGDLPSEKNSNIHIHTYSTVYRHRVAIPTY